MVYNESVANNRNKPTKGNPMNAQEPSPDVIEVVKLSSGEVIIEPLIS
jgi:hypothetical protein